MKKIFKYILVTVLFLFVVVNALVAIHSYKFTHVTDDIQASPKVEKDIPLSTKLKILFTGIDLPRFVSDTTPRGNYKDIEIQIDNEKSLGGWYIPTDSVKKGIVLVFHGYVDNKSSMLDVSDEMLKFGYDVLMIDFMGAGKSYGNQTTMGYLEAENVFATYNYALNEMHEDNIFLYGFSMGAAAVMKAQHDYQMNVAGIMVQAAYATFEGTIEARVEMMGAPRQPLATFFTYWMGKVNGFDGFEANPIEDAKKIEVPTLVMCGMKDPNIPKEETEAIFEAVASNSKALKLFENSKHESILRAHPNEWKETVGTFLNTIEKKHIHANCEEFFTEETR